MGSAAWNIARSAAERAGVSVRTLTDLRDADRMATVIARVWGSEQVVPRELVRAFQHSGSVLLGAESGRELVAFTLGFAGLEDGLHLHSHMLGVVPERQSGGVGYALKLAQRAVCLANGIEEVRWTYDPLLARNARFNLVKLGALGIRLFRDFYGQMADRLNRGDRSDRFEVSWELESERVHAALAGEPPPAPAAYTGQEGRRLLGLRGTDEAPEPVEMGGSPGDTALVAVPPDHMSLRRRDPGLGSRWRDAAARAFERCFESGMVATGMTADSSYVFERVTHRR